MLWQLVQASHIALMCVQRPTDAVPVRGLVQFGLPSFVELQLCFIQPYTRLLSSCRAHKLTNLDLILRAQGVLSWGLWYRCLDRQDYICMQCRMKLRCLLLTCCHMLPPCL
jgi:hypothetical protein